MLTMTRLVMLGVLLCGLTLVAQETATLTTPEPVVGPSITKYRIDSFYQKFDDPDTGADEGVLQILLVGVERPVTITCRYEASTNPTGTFLNNGLNKANLSSAYNNNATTGSQKQRIYHRLVVMAEASAVCGRELVGTLTGSVP